MGFALSRRAIFFRMDTVRIGCVKYQNTLPLIEGLGMWRGCELVTSAPSGLIGMLRRGEVDVALASVVDGARGVADAKQSPRHPLMGCCCRWG